MPFDNGELVPHELTHFDGEPATCTEAGSREHWKCEACGNLSSDGQGENVTTEEAVRLAAI